MCTCADCNHFDYDEVWDGEEEYGYFTCYKGHYERVGWDQIRCEDFESTFVTPNLGFSNLI